MQHLKVVLFTSLIISCMADEMKKHQSNDTMMDQKAKDMKPSPGDHKTTKDAKSTPSSDASMKHTTMDPKMMDSKMTTDSKPMDSKTPDSKSTEGTPADVKRVPGVHKDSNEQPKSDQMPKSKEDMKAESTVGLGFYAGVVPVSYGGYGGYGYGRYGYPSYPYYRSYYPRPYYSYPYRPVVPVIVRPRPVPLLLG